MTRETRTFLYIVIFCILASAPFAVASNGVSDVKQVSDQPYGEYLAGFHAAIHNDLRTAADYYQKALALDSDNQAILRKSFTLFIADGRYDAAVQTARKLAKLNISDSMVQMFLLLQKFRTNDYDAALANLDNLGDAGVYGLFKPLFRSWILLAQGKEDVAEANMQELLTDKSFLGFKKFHAGLFYDFIGKTQLAEKMYSESLVIPGAMSLRTIEAYGILLRRLGRTGDARQLYVNYLAKAPDNPQLRRALSNLDNKKRARLYITSEKDGVAEIFYTASSFLMQDNIRMPATLYLRFAKYLRHDYYIADYLLGQIFDREKYYQGAMEGFGQIDKNHPLYFSAQIQMAWLLEKMGRSDEAIAAMEKLSGKFSDNGPEKREILAALGDINRIHGNFEAAGKAYSKYIDGISDFEEKHWSIFYMRGIAYQQDSKWQLAEADFLKALELHPDQPQVLNYLAYSWIDQGVNIEKARKMLIRAVELRPYDGYIVDSLGWAFYQIGNMSRAVEYLEKAVLLQTGDWAINDHLGDAYWAMGRKYEAKFQWQHALSLKPDQNLVAKIKAKIRTKIKTKIKDGEK